MQAFFVWEKNKQKMRIMSVQFDSLALKKQQATPNPHVSRMKKTIVTYTRIPLYTIVCPY